MNAASSEMFYSSGEGINTGVESCIIEVETDRVEKYSEGRMSTEDGVAVWRFVHGKQEWEVVVSFADADRRFVCKTVLFSRLPTTKQRFY